ncbi:MAG: hypothetical protein R3C99_00400 [Pirellulaceae bacterium]
MYQAAARAGRSRSSGLAFIPAETISFSATMARLATGTRNMETDLEKRIAALEAQFAELVRLVEQRRASTSWREVVGMFADDPHIGELHRETERLREEDRAAQNDNIFR